MSNSAYVKKGKLVVLEGIDGAGTTTQVKRLVDFYGPKITGVYRTAQPSDGPAGKLIRQYLRKEVTPFPSWETMALLFAADRRHQYEFEIGPALSVGANVFCDRHILSSQAYQAATAVKAIGTADSHWWYMEVGRVSQRVRDVNWAVPDADATLYLDVPVYEAAKRRGQAERDMDEEFETNDFQKAVKLAFGAIMSHEYSLKREAEREQNTVFTIDGKGREGEVTERCVLALRQMLGEPW